MSQPIEQQFSLTPSLSGDQTAETVAFTLSLSPSLQDEEGNAAIVASIPSSSAPSSSSVPSQSPPFDIYSPQTPKVTTATAAIADVEEDEKASDRKRSRSSSPPSSTIAKKPRVDDEKH